jgi:hypothetical protein
MEWLEMVIRMCFLKYGDGISSNFSSCVQAFVDNTLSNISANVVESESNQFRCNRMYNHRVDELMKANVQVLQGIFLRFKGSTASEQKMQVSNMMDMQDWNHMIFTLGLQELGLTAREAQMIFIKSIPLCVNELVEPQKAHFLTLAMFQEAVCRIADAIDVPNAQVNASIIDTCPTIPILLSVFLCIT